MTGRERLFAVLDGMPTDHVPIWLLFPYHPMENSYADVKKLPRFQPVVQAIEKKGITLDRRPWRFCPFSREVEVSDRSFEENGEQVRVISLTYRGKSLTQETRVSRSRTSVKKLLNTPEDFDFYYSLPLQEADETRRIMDRFLSGYLRERAEFPEELGSMMLDLGEPIEQLYGASNLEELAIASLAEEFNAGTVDFLERLMNVKRVVYEYTLERNLAEVYFMVGSELAAPPMFTLETFNQWIVPFAGELIEMIHASGGKVIQHFHGQVKELLPVFSAMKADALHTIEAPPIGNCTMSEAFAITGNKLTLIGNIQYDDFRSFSPAAMREAVLELLVETRRKRFILSPSAGPFDAEVSDRFLENYLTMINTAWEFKVS